MSAFLTDRLGRAGYAIHPDTWTGHAQASAQCREPVQFLVVPGAYRGIEAGKRGRRVAVLAQQVATRDMRQTERSAQQGGLSALACARAAKQQDELRVKLTEVALHDRVY